MNFLLTFKSIFILLAMSIPGYIIAKTKLVKSQSAIKILSILLLYVCQPFITINAFLNTNFDKKIALNLVWIFLFTFLSIIIIMGISQLIFSKDKGKQNKDIYSFACSFGNIGYLCIPFLQVLTNNNTEIILYATCSLVAFNLLVWTLGSYIITKDKKYISLKKTFLNPPTLTFILVLPFFIFNINFIRFPSLNFISDAFALFADMTGPLSMLILGLKFSEMKFVEIFNDYRVYITCLIKLLITPIVIFSLYHLFNLFIDLQSLKLNLIALSAMPCATNVMMFASLFDSDGKAAARSVLLSSLLSIITIPFVLMLMI